MFQKIRIDLKKATILYSSNNYTLYLSDLNKKPIKK